jgi:hypothetical protein
MAAIVPHPPNDFGEDTYNTMTQLRREPMIPALTSASRTSCLAKGIRLVATLLTIVVLLFCGFMHLLFESSEHAAYALMPPLYPGSTLAGRWRSGGTDSQWDRRTYTTTVTPQMLIDYYRERFSTATYSTQGSSHSFSICDRSPLARMVARWINEGRYSFYTANTVPLPCVSVKIDTKNQRPTGTTYSLDIEWPSP